MAAVRSLGVHTPSALSHLIAEGILPKSANPDLYTWETYVNNDVEEEVLFTPTCVAWSQGRVIRKLFSFDIEKEKVQHALLTWFPSHESHDDTSSSESLKGVNSKTQTKGAPTEGSAKIKALRKSSSRALVVLLQYQAHIFFLSGASHLVKLPFEVEKAFPAPRGIVLQRKLAPGQNPRSQASSTRPPAPQNSFQSPLSFKSLQAISSRLPKAQYNDQDYNAGLDFSLLDGLESPNEDSIPRHFSLTSPLSEFSLVVRAPLNNPDFWASSTRATRSLESLETTEELLYISPADECADIIDAKPLLLVVTADYEKGLYSIWNATYLDPKPISRVLTGASTPTVTSKNRRRSSYVNTTGTVTPAVRPRGLRESVSKTASTNTKTSTTTRKKKASRKTDTEALQEAEDDLASQIDPDFAPRRTTRETRRVSSMISRADLNPSFDKTAFQDLASQHGPGNSFGQHGRRGHSLGNGSDKLSFGASQRRLRASTPGSFSYLSIDDVTEGARREHAFEGSQTSATFDDYQAFADMNVGVDEDEYGGIDFQAPSDGLKKELLVRKFADFAIRVGSAQKSRANISGGSTDPRKSKVLTMVSPINCGENEPYNQRFFIYIFNHGSSECVLVEYSVRHNPSTKDVAQKTQHKSRRTVPMPSFRSIVGRMNNIVDIIKVSDRGQSRVLFLRSKNGVNSVWLSTPWSPETSFRIPIGRLRVFNPLDITSALTPISKAIGVRRSLPPPRHLTSLAYAGPNGLFDIVLDGKAHRLHLQLWPTATTISKIFDALFFALPLAVIEKIWTIWWTLFNSTTQSVQHEWDSFAVALYVLFQACEVDRRKRIPKRLTEGSPIDKGPTMIQKLEASWNVSSTHDSNAWSWAIAANLSNSKQEDTPQRRNTITSSPSKQKAKPPNSMKDHNVAAREFVRSVDAKDLMDAIRNQQQSVMQSFPRLVAVLHLMREELKLSSTGRDADGPETKVLAPVIAQLGRWLDWPEWDWKGSRYYRYEQSESYDFDDVPLFVDGPDPLIGFEAPPSILAAVESVSTTYSMNTYPSFDRLVTTNSAERIKELAAAFTPRARAILRYFNYISSQLSRPYRLIESMLMSGIRLRMIETFPESLVAFIKDPLIRCQSSPPTTWSASQLTFISREDLTFRATTNQLPWTENSAAKATPADNVRDIHSISQSAEITEPILSFPNSDRMAISRLIFNSDKRLSEAVHMIEPYRLAVAECNPGPNWTEAQSLDAQREVHNWVMTRTFSLAPGLGFAHYDSRYPILSEKFTIHGYSTLCVMKPLNNTVSLDRSTFTEERYAWAWFHLGVSAGLSISKSAEGIDSSWIVFNRPSELNNRHAGLLLALGLNGHLKSMAKWLSFKYLTPKHTMTSIGILLGLSASHLGSMDTLVTRLLSVHVTRMLPPGAAELNLSSLTQTAGLMGIGMLYYNTQHRRMSEVMLSEIENMDGEDPAGTLEPIRDEGYRLAAAYALGLINLGQGSDLKGLHDLRLVERLLAIAVGPRKVNLVDMIDQATAGATIAITLIFLKTGNRTIARKIDIPDTVAQFDFVRPDVLLLRTLAKHLILWDDIRADYKWVVRNLPKEYSKIFNLREIKSLSSDHMPFYNILAGLLWSVSLKFAGSGNTKVRDFLLAYLDQFIRLCRLPALRYDSRLTRNTVRNCQDLVALSVATVLAGTGDLEVFRRLRSLHGRVNPDTPYGSHMAAHMALGALFFGAGCYTFGTNNLAIASLIIAFYPVFPMDVTDNKAHLQAFRHFWALAAEPRCIIPRDIDTGRAISLDIVLKMRDGSTEYLSAPKLLPDLDSIARISTHSTEYWPVTLDFASNPSHLTSFRHTQAIHVRRRPAHEAHSSPFTATLLTINDARRDAVARSGRESIFKLLVFEDFEMTDFGPLLNSEDRGIASLDMRGSSIDDWLLLGETARHGWSRERLWNLKILLAWADRAEIDGRGEVKWVRKEILEKWKAIIEERARERIKL